MQRAASDPESESGIWKSGLKTKLSAMTLIRSTPLLYNSRAHQLSGSKCKIDFISKVSWWETTFKITGITLPCFQRRILSVDKLHRAWV